MKISPKDMNNETEIYLFFALVRNFSHVKQGVCHDVALPFTLKSISRQRKNYGNSNILPCKNIIFKKSSERNQNPARRYNSITNLKFQHKPKYHLEKFLVSKWTYYLGAKIP